jgi:flagellar biosynthetic protein FliR
MLNIRISPEVSVLFMLLFARLGALGMLMPGFGETGIPARVRLSIVLLLSLMLYPVLSGQLPHGLLGNPARLMVTLFGELAIGIFVGLVGRLTLSAVQIAGAIVAAQTSLSFSMSVDPTQGQQGAVVGNLLSILSVTLVFVLDLHHLSLQAIVSSYKLFPPGQWLELGDFSAAALRLVAESFKIGVQMSAPFVVFGLVFNFGLGVLAKLMPQFQIFFVAMPGSILLGLLLLMAVIGSMMLYFTAYVEAGLGRLIAG